MTTYTRRLLPLALAAFFLAPLGAFAAEGSIDGASLTTTSTKPALAGEADARTVRVLVRNDDGKQVFKKDLRVKKDGAWKTKVSKKLKDGEYEVSLYEGKTSRESALLDQETLTVGKSASSLTVSSIPLLTGGTTRAYASVPVAYVKVANPGTKPASITGISLVQNGSAPTSVIASFSTNDDKGGSRATVPSAFKQKTVFVPLAATIPAGQMRIFTVKANLGAVSSFGTQLSLDVASVAGASKGAFPIRGTTWTLGY